MAMAARDHRRPEDPQERALWDAFQKFDANGDGKIQEEEFVKLMKSLGSFSTKEIMRLFSEADTDGSGGVDWREFIRWICSGNATKDMSVTAAKSFARLVQAETKDEASFIEEAAVSHAVTTYLKEANQERTDAEEQSFRKRKQHKARKMGRQQDGAYKPAGDGLDVPEDYTGFRLTVPVTFECATALMNHFLVNGESDPLHPKYVNYLTSEFTAAYRQLHPKPVVQIDTPPDGRLIIVGDTHGQLADVMHILHNLGPPTAKNRYVINGDVADRGHQSTEILLLIFAFFLADPQCLIFNRGNHENEDMNALDADSGGGFADEVLGKYGLMAYRRFVSAFKVLSVCTVVQREIFVIHGGLTRVKSLTIDYINSIEHLDCTAPHPMSTNVKDQIFSDLLWSDPTTQHGKFKSERGIGIKFGPDMTTKFCMQNRLRFIVRSHQVPEDGRGYMKQHEGRCVTVFSASNYCGTGGNYGAVLVLASANFPKYEIYEHYALPLEQLARSLGHGSEARAQGGSKPDQEAAAAARWQKELEKMIVGVIERKPQLWAHVVDASMSHTVPMEEFEELMCEFVEGIHPWAEAAKYWGITNSIGQVEIGKFLGRWIVSLESSRYTCFLLSAMRQFYEAIVGLDMDLEQSFKLFDADGDGSVELKEIRQVLGMFDLGLTHMQLDRLTGQIFTHAARNSTGGASIGKIKVQDFLGQFTMIYKHSNVEGSSLESWMVEALEHIGRLILKTPADKLVSDLDQAAMKIQKVHRGNAARKGLTERGEAQPASPSRKSTRSSTAPSRKSVVAAAQLRRAITPTEAASPSSGQAAAAGTESLASAKMMALFRALDSSGDGVLETEEFVNGLVKVPGITSIVAQGIPLTHERLLTIMEAIDVSRNGTINYLEFLQAFQTSSDEDSMDMGATLIEDITTVLFRHRLAIRKGCVYLDEDGAGAISAEDFKKVLQGVNNVLARPERTLTNTQINLLVEGLTTSEATCEEEALVDYEAFLRSFVILDTAQGRAVVKRF